MRRRYAFTLVLSILLAASMALGQEPLEQARTFFNAGAQAYEKGNYPAAIQAFEAAYALVKRPTLMFSIAQAQRHQYYLDKDRAVLDAAIESYHAYLKLAPDGNRRGDVAEALAELEPLRAKLAAADPAEAPAPAQTTPPKTRLMVSTTTRGARVSVDGGKQGEMPLIAEVKPGKHRIQVTADGYFPEERQVSAAEGGVVALDIPLRPRPATLTVTTAPGADVSVDGRLVGVTPLAAPLRVEPGRHLIAVSKNGHRPYVEELELGNGEQRELSPAMEQTPQRIASHVLLGAGIAGIAAGGACATVAFLKDRDAQAIQDQRKTGNISFQDVDEYDRLRSERDTWRLAAGISLGAGAAVATTGLLLRAFDTPKIEAPRPRESDQPAAPERSPGLMEVGIAPVFGPGHAGASVSGRF